MGLLDQIRSIFSQSPDRNSYWIYASCGQCQEALRARVDLAHDLSVRYDAGGQIDGYFTRKTLIGGNQCFNQVEVFVEYDSRRRPTAHEVSGGQLINQQEYELQFSDEASAEKTAEA